MSDYQPWWAHNQALLNRRRPKAEKIRADEDLRGIVREKLTEKWSPQQTARFLARTYPDQPAMRACPETIYRALYSGLLGFKDGKLRTGRSKRKAHRRGVPVPNRIKNMTLVHQRPLDAGCTVDANALAGVADRQDISGGFPASVLALVDRAIPVGCGSSEVTVLIRM